ncbi:hypothetical protein C8F01DRAFT_1090201 [Mycena amicta]|nr:hypothetical protein C8F01DRAFT_1090201 [Mycena amicta]
MSRRHIDPKAPGARLRTAMPCPVCRMHAPLGAMQRTEVPCGVRAYPVPDLEMLGTTRAGVHPCLKQTLRWLGTDGLKAHTGHSGHADEMRQTGAHSCQPLRARRQAWEGRSARGALGDYARRRSSRLGAKSCVGWALRPDSSHRALGPRRESGALGPAAARRRAREGGSGGRKRRRKRNKDVGAGSETTGLSWARMESPRVQGDPEMNRPVEAVVGREEGGESSRDGMPRGFRDKNDNDFAACGVRAGAGWLREQEDVAEEIA